MGDERDSMYLVFAVLDFTLVVAFWADLLIRGEYDPLMAAALCVLSIMGGLNLTWYFGGREW